MGIMLATSGRLSVHSAMPSTQPIISMSFRPKLWILWMGVALVPFSVGYAVLAFTDGSFDVQSLVLVAFAPIGVWFGYRCTRVRIIVSPNSITVWNYVHTRSARRRQITAIDLNIRNMGEAGRHWMPQVQNSDGSAFWLTCLDSGPIRWPPESKPLEVLHEIRSILQVGGTDSVGYGHSSGR